MKKFNLLKSIGTVLILLIVLNCSVDSSDTATINNSINEINLSKKIKNNHLSKNIEQRISPCNQSEIRIVYAIYDFPILSHIDENGNNITQQQIREDFETEMAQYFTICNVIASTSCDNIDKWIVNYDEFLVFWSDPTRGTGSGSGSIGVQGGSPTGPWDCDFPESRI